MANVIASLMKTLAENYPAMIQSGLELIGKLVGGLIRAIPQIVGAMPQIIGAIVNAFASVDWIDLGKNIILGIVRGIAGAAGEIAKALGDVCKNALNSAKKSLGIHSPSRVFRDEVGKYIPEGMAVGITANTSDVTEAIDDMKTQAVAASKMEISSRYTSTAQKNYDDKVDAILGLLAEYLPDCAEPTVIDGNSLVDGINTQLGLAVV
jgi:phage-related protein